MVARRLTGRRRGIPAPPHHRACPCPLLWGHGCSGKRQSMEVAHADEVARNLVPGMDTASTPWPADVAKRAPSRANHCCYPVPRHRAPVDRKCNGCGPGGQPEQRGAGYGVRSCGCKASRRFYQTDSPADRRGHDHQATARRIRSRRLSGRRILQRLRTRARGGHQPRDPKLAEIKRQINEVKLEAARLQLAIAQGQIVEIRTIADVVGRALRHLRGHLISSGLEGRGHGHHVQHARPGAEAD